MAATTVGFGLGSNIGDAPANLREALRLIAARNVARLTAVSRIYRTAPWGDVDQREFANACAVGETSLAPYELLAAVKTIEADMGREPTRRWGPRLIDIDILFYGTQAIEDPELTIPHRELFARRFVLAPLAEIAPEWSLGGVTVKEALRRLEEDDVNVWDSEKP